MSAYIGHDQGPERMDLGPGTTAHGAQLGIDQVKDARAFLLEALEGCGPWELPHVVRGAVRMLSRGLAGLGAIHHCDGCEEERDA